MREQGLGPGLLGPERAGGGREHLSTKIGGSQAMEGGSVGDRRAEEAVTSLEGGGERGVSDGASILLMQALPVGNSSVMGRQGGGRPEGQEAGSPGSHTQLRQDRNCTQKGRTCRSGFSGPKEARAGRLDLRAGNNCMCSGTDRRPGLLGPHGRGGGEELKAAVSASQSQGGLDWLGL